MERIRVFILWLLTGAIRIGLAVAVGLLYEAYWFSHHHLLGYLWTLNQFRIKGPQVEATVELAQSRYHLKLRIFINTCIALVYSLVLWQRIIWFDGLKQLVWKCFWISALLYLTQYPIALLTGLHWQAHLHNCIHSFYLLFGMGLVLTLRKGFRFQAEEDKKKNE